MNQKRPGHLIMVGPTQWIYVTVFLLGVGPLIVANLYPDELFALWFRSSFAQDIQRQFGFKMRWQRMYYREQPLRAFVITDLQPDGILAKAGIRNGDVPVGAYHMSDVGFYRTLQRAELNPVKIHLINCNDYEELAKSGTFFDPARMRRVFIPKVPSEQLSTRHVSYSKPAQHVAGIFLILALLVTIEVWRRLNCEMYS